MTISRRQFLQKAALGSTTFAAASSRSFFFPKPATAYSLNYLLSKDAPANTIFRNFLSANVIRNASPNVPTTDGAVLAAVKTAQQEFTARKFNDNQTPFAQRLSSVNSPLWGRQRNESLGINPGFGTVQIIDNLASPIAFTGSTTVGIDSAIRVLRANEKIDPLLLDEALIPVEEQFEDWGTWVGDVNLRTGAVSPTSITRYATRFGDVRRRYSVIKPGRGGYGVIVLNVDSGRDLKVNLEITVRFN